MTHIPYRTGVTTIKFLLRKVCDLLLRYGDVIRGFTPTDKHVYIAALMQACEDFQTNIPNPRP